MWRVMHGNLLQPIYEEDFISLNLNGWQSMFTSRNCLNPGACYELTR